MSERMSEDMSEDMSERMSKDMSERMSEDISEKISENMSDKISEDVCYDSQGKCLWIMLPKTNSFATGHAAKLILCHLMLRTAANTCGSTFRAQASEVGLAAMSSELVVERPAAIFIGTPNRFAKGVGYVWRYVLPTIGPERIYVCMEPPSTMHAGDCMLIVPEVVEGTLWYVLYEGRAVPNEEGEQELEQRAPIFLLYRAGPVTPKRCKRHSGKHLTSWFAHAMRCSCGCVLTCVALHLWTQLLLGGAVRCNRMQL